MDARDDGAFMQRALELARLGRGRVRPNPLVGAVVVRDGRIVGEGWHEEYGGDHAEVRALRAAGDACRGATLYVTLEPCAHHGSTPPCTDAIEAAGVARVVFAASDPNAVARGGADRLRAAGIAVEGGVERAAARDLNAGFFHIHEHATPFVALKLAMSLDGRIAAAPAHRTLITGAAARAETHRLRAAHDAVMVGSGTALADDPLLTVRDAVTRVQPARVVLDSAARLPLASRLVETAAETPLVVIVAEDAPADRIAALERCGVRVLSAPAGPHGNVDLARALGLLCDAGLRTIFCEGGGRLASALLMAGHVQRLHLFVAPVFLGSGGVPAFELPLPPDGAWRTGETAQFGPDTLITLTRDGA